MSACWPALRPPPSDLEIYICLSSPKSLWVWNGVKDPVGVPGAWAPWSWTGDRSDTELAEGSECTNVCKGQGGDPSPDLSRWRRCMGQTHPFLCKRRKPTQTENPGSEPNKNNQERERGCAGKGFSGGCWRDRQTDDRQTGRLRVGASGNPSLESPGYSVQC